MTTPAAMNRLLEHIRERFDDARASAKENEKTAPGSWGAVYDLGYSDALGELLEHITGDAARSPQETAE